MKIHILYFSQVLDGRKVMKPGEKAARREDKHGSRVGTKYSVHAQAASTFCVCHIIVHVHVYKYFVQLKIFV